MSLVLGNVGTPATQLPEHKLRGTARGLIARLRVREPQFAAIAIHPQAGIYRRFGKCRAQLLDYLEDEVERQEHELETYMRDVDEGLVPEAGRSDAEIRSTLNKRMMSLADVVQRHGDLFEQSSRISRSTIPAKFFMRFRRAYSPLWDEESQLVQDEELSCSGGLDGTLQSDLTALQDDGLNPLARFMAYRLAEPFMDYLWEPLAKLWYGIRAGRRTTYHISLAANIDCQKIVMLAKLFAGLIATACLAATIGVLYTVKDTKTQIVVMTLFGFAFCLAPHLVGPKSMPTFALATA
ncbi:hypothetical protein BDV96DRAFT_597010 [Lophiotrema nucula]|uniref:DUF6594 domain-containing protein n=1 Tax=Lophiotrema nucula TaxID=690887 RepID=A0A6A5ZFX8_9PLEO|nr:hypothetical protein BDV96DRAFT_597010 [Lophiotrema nucula]